MTHRIIREETRYGNYVLVVTFEEESACISAQEYLNNKKNAKEWKYNVKGGWKSDDDELIAEKIILTEEEIKAGMSCYHCVYKMYHK